MTATYPPDLLARTRRAFLIHLHELPAERLHELVEAIREESPLDDIDFIEPCDVTDEQDQRNSRPLPY